MYPGEFAECNYVYTMDKSDSEIIRLLYRKADYNTLCKKSSK